jgi:hypothetical protein
MTQRFINPLKMGLLGGFAAWASTLEKYNLLNAQNEARQSQIKTKYDAMAQVQSEREKNNALLKQMALEANQRTSKVDGVPGDDGKLNTVTYRSVYNPATQQYEQKEIGRVPYESKSDIAAQSQKAIADRMAGTQQAAADRQAGREDAVSRRTNQRLDAAETKADAQRQKDKEGQAEAATNADMKEFHRATPEQKAALLKEAGVEPEVADPTATHRTLAHPLSGEPDPNATKPNEKAAEQYRKAMLEQHKQELGLGAETPPAGGAVPTGAQPQMTPDGRQIKYDANGNAFIKGPDGKPVPYVADANGMPDSPLAMDTADMGDEEQPAGDEEQAPQGAGLIAGADQGEEEGEPTPDDEEGEGEPQGLMSGQYA